MSNINYVKYFLQEVSALLLERASLPIQSAPVWTVSQYVHFYQGALLNTIINIRTSENQNIRIPGRLPDYSDRAGIQNQVREVDNNAIPANNPSWYGYQFTGNEPKGASLCNFPIRILYKQATSHFREVKLFNFSCYLITIVTYYLYANKPSLNLIPYTLQDLGPPPRSDKTIESWPDDVKIPGELYWKSLSYVGCSAPGLPKAETTLKTQEQVLIIDKNMGINCDTHRARQTEPQYRLRDSCGLTILLRIVKSFGGVDVHQRQRTINNIIRTPAPKCYWLFGISILRQYHHSSVCKEVWQKYLYKTARNCQRNMEPLSSNKHAPPGHIRSVCDKFSGCTKPTDRADRMSISSALQNSGIIRTTRSQPIFIENKHKAKKLFQPILRQQGRRLEPRAFQLVSLNQPLLLPSLEPDIPGSPKSAQRTSDNHFDRTSMEDRNMVSEFTGIVSCLSIASTGNDGHTRLQKRKISAVERQELMPHSIENQQLVLQAQDLSDTAINIIFSNKQAVKHRSRYHSTQKHFLDWHLKKISQPPSKLAMFLVADPKTVGNSPCIKEFLRAIDETKIKSFFSPEIDIYPIMLKINDNIHRIDDARTIIIKDTLKIMIIASKEKQLRHPNPILCSVLAYNVYKASITTELCLNTHAKNNSIAHKRHLKNLSVLIKRPPNTPISKARAIDANLAASSKVPVENIVSHEFLSKYSIFDTYYRLDRSTQSNMTEAVLPLE
ncbi:hypothetical protein BB561_003967 [Smittium simulii]|uniref:Uncharacterized protein n=1 Tax=Smittium simulii TaxID=133385 RepID=A0A2T9YIN0_9FUNG|nr:hypothetical protein BB561_003967 [Smittium simulii]